MMNCFIISEMLVWRKKLETVTTKHNLQHPAEFTIIPSGYSVVFRLRMGTGACSNNSRDERQEVAAAAAAEALMDLFRQQKNLLVQRWKAYRDEPFVGLGLDLCLRASRQDPVALSVHRSRRR